jgi:hypothetical protein
MELTRKRQSGGQEEGVAAPLIAALERAWSDVRRRHPELPPAVLITGSGSEGPRRRAVLRLGHFAAGRWQAAARAEAELPEIFVGGEGLERGARPVLATLLHEAAHALADVRGIKDTSRQGRYHNRRFKALAEELGLQIDQAPGIGWSATTLPDATAERYADTIAALEQAITIYRRHERGGPEPAQRSKVAACVCGCPRRIRVAPGVLAAGPIICGVCGQPFEPDDTGDQGGERTATDD